MFNVDHTMSLPHVVPILWGDVYAQNPDTVQNIHDMVSDLVTGPFMNGMAQYGILRGSVQAPIVIHNSNPPPTIIYYDSNNNLQDDITKKILAWIEAGLVPAVPPVDQLYLIIPCPASHFETYDGSSDPKGNGVQGYHNEGVTNPATSPPCLWAIVKTDFVNSWSNGPISSKNFVSLGIAPTVCHELAEQFVDLNGTYREIGDACTNNQYVYRGWTVQQYLSVWAGKTCINGDSPVSTKRFLQAIGYPPSQGLRALAKTNSGEWPFNIAFIADAMSLRET